MTLARLGTTSLFLGVWTPLVALAIVWAAAGSGTPIVFALEQAGVDQIDRTAVALVFAPPLPYLIALGALAIGLAAQRFTPDTPRSLEVRRAALRIWITAGVVLSAAAPLSLYAEHGTSHEPADDVHLVLGVATWIWWSMTATAITVAVALRSQVALVGWASRSRYVAGTSLGVGVLSLSVASVAVAPRPARLAIGEWMPPLDVVATSTESIVLALADGDEHYTWDECIEASASRKKGKSIIAEITEGLARRYPGLDAENVVVEALLEVCEEEPRPEEVRSHLKTTAGRRAIDRLRQGSTAERHAPRVAGLLGGSLGVAARPDATRVLRCLLEEEVDDMRAALLSADPVAHLMTTRPIRPESAKRAIDRAWQRVAPRLEECADRPLR